LIGRISSERRHENVWLAGVERMTDGLQLSELRRNLATVTVATVGTAIIAGFVLSCLPIPKLHAGLPFLELLPATIAAVGISLVVVTVGYGSGLFSATSVNMILLSLALRPVLTLGLAGLVAGLFESLRVPYFFLVVASVYLVNLAIETRQLQRAICVWGVGGDGSAVSRVSGSVRADQLSGSRVC